MLRLVRSAWRTADRLIQAPSPPALKQPWNNLIHTLKGGASVATSATARGAVSKPSSAGSTIYNIPRHAHRSPPFKTTLSLPARIALQRPMSNMSTFLPRTPALPRTVSQVGLGTARNFSSTRHVFQNLVENVSIAARALSEADWDVRSVKGENRRRLVIRKKKANQMKIADKLQARDLTSAVCSSALTGVSSTFEEEFSTYFGPAADQLKEENTTTSLTIPLYPVTERAPLPNVTESSCLLPMSELRAIHGDHALHGLRVQSLFTRLDAGDVWSRDVECECYGGSATSPHALRIVFKGWTEDMVRAVIGEAGKGWCEMEQVGPEQPDAVVVVEDPVPSMSFIIPNLDFSSSFLASQPAPYTEPEEEEHHLRYATPMSDWTPFSTHPPSPSLTAMSQETFGGDYYEEPGFISEEEFEHGSDGHHSSSSSSSLGFSVEFLSRSADDTRSLSFSDHGGW